MKKSLLILCALIATVVAKAQYGPYPIIPIDTVQFVSSSKLTRVPPTDSSDYVNPVKKNLQYGDTVRVDGYVMMDPRAYGLSISRKGTFIQRDTNGTGKPWSGVLVLADPSPSVITPSSITANNTIGGFLTETKFYSNLQMGTKVRVTGVIRQFNVTGTSTGETQIDMIHDVSANLNSVQVLDATPRTISPLVMTVDSFMTGSTAAGNATVNRTTAEKYAGMYVELRNVTVATRAANGSKWVWSVIDDNGNAIQIRDFSGYFRNDGLEDTSLHLAHNFTPPQIGARLAYIRGAITEAISNGVPVYWIAPLNPSDIGGITYSSPNVSSVNRIPNIATPTDSVLIVATVLTGSRPVATAKLFYTVGYNSLVFDSVAMTKNIPTPGVWYAKIPNKAVGSIVKYWMKIIDSNGVFKNYPDTFGTKSAYIVTTNGINSIAQLQYSPYTDVSTIWNNDSLLNINIQGTVTGINFIATGQSLLTIQNGTGANSAIYIQRAASNDATAGWAIGDSVAITAATVKETFNVTTLNSIAATKISSGRPLPPFATGLPIDSFRLNKVLYARPWEGVLMRWDSMVVLNVNPDAPSNFYEWSFAKDTLAPTGLRVDDMNASIHNVSALVRKGLKLNFVQGPMFFSHGDFKMIPRSLNDIDLSRIDSIKPVVSLKGKAFDTVFVNSTYVDSGATALDNIDGDITSKIVKVGTVNTAVLGNYTLTYSATDSWGNIGTVQRKVNVKSTVGIHENEIMAAAVSIYPSPAQNEITISASGIQSLPVTISIIDIVGKELMAKQVKQGTFEEKVDITKLQNGIYFLTINNDKGSRTIKFLVNGK